MYNLKAQFLTLLSLPEEVDIMQEQDTLKEESAPLGLSPTLFRLSKL